MSNYIRSSLIYLKLQNVLALLLQTLSTIFENTNGKLYLIIWDFLSNVFRRFLDSPWKPYNQSKSSVVYINHKYENRGKIISWKPYNQSNSSVVYINDKYENRGKIISWKAVINGC